MRTFHDSTSRRPTRVGFRPFAQFALGWGLVLGLALPSASAAEENAETSQPSLSETQSDSRLWQTGTPIVVAQANESGNAKGSRPLEPRYKALEPEEKSWYNGSYIFGMTRGLADSTIVPAAKAPLFLFTVPLDIAFLPFAVIGGMFG